LFVCPRRIVSKSARICVLATAEFDDPFGSGAEKIDDIVPGRLLPAKAPIRESSVARTQPQLAFMVGHPLTEFARKFLFQ
jgi:hypothetical protein